MDKTREEDIKIKTLLQQKNRTVALSCLQRRKLYEKQLERQQNMLNELEKQKFNLEAADETSAVFETLSIATAASRDLLKGEGE